ncbi:MAG: CBS domain-containing protein [Oscillospiraceae bacterium]|nr:CBS domain-containing protein [Oscillospiraceae bacterium]
MKVRDIMTSQVIRIGAEESVSVAARTLAHYNIGVLPVCGSDGRVCGVLTDRDIVTRCLAANRTPDATTVREVMTSQVLSVRPDMDAGTAAHMMGKQQVRRLPVVENGRLCGMLSLGDLANSEENSIDASDALTEITSNISRR